MSRTIAVCLVLVLLLLRFASPVGIPQFAVTKVATRLATTTITSGTVSVTVSIITTLVTLTLTSEEAASMATTTTSEDPLTESVLLGSPLVAGPATSTSTWTYVSVGTYSPTATTTSSSIPPSTSSSTSTAAEPAIHTITVGKGTNQFEPDQIVAGVSDIVTFEFYPVNHSVVQAEFGYPCIPISTMNANLPTFFSGFFPVSTVSSDPPTWNLTINDTSPILFYCSAPGSCIDYGMVGGINLNATTPLATQIMRAKTQGIMLQPGEPFQSEAEASSVSSMVSAASTPTTTAGAEQTPNNDAPSLLSPGAIAGVVVAGLVALGLLGALLWFWSRSRALRRTLDAERKTTEEVVNSLDSGGGGGTQGHLQHQHQQLLLQQQQQQQQSPTSPTTRSSFSPLYSGRGQMALRTGSVYSGRTFGPGGGSGSGSVSVRSPVSPVGGGMPAAELEAKLSRHSGTMSSTAISEVAGDEPVRQEFG